MFTIRPATLNDVPAISAIHRSDIVTWKRWGPDGESRVARYEDLTPYERWLNGGPWLDEGTCAFHLARWLANASLALVAEEAGRVVAEAEAIVSDEPLPFGRNLNVSVLYTLRGRAGRGLGSALMAELFAIARRERCDTVMVGHAEAPAFYAKHGLTHVQTWRRARLPVKTSQTQYTAERFEEADYDVVRGWAMPIGRHQSARQEWERLRPGAEPDFDEWRGLGLERWRLTVRRSPAVLILDESPRHPGVANVHLWLPPGLGLTRQLLAAIRDRAARSGFVELACFMHDQQIPWLGPEARDDDYTQDVWLKSLHA
jgi:GNAT superfamily N-acetyltransferase